jgi:hypothetical protein
VYIHNNANPSAIGADAATAKNTSMTVLLPRTNATTAFAAASISADNANPGTVSDTVDFNGANPFTMAFDQTQPVQMTYRPNGAGDFVTSTLHAASFTNDHVLTANFGDWHGCFNYAALVTMTVVVHMPTTPPPVTPTYTCDAFNITADVNRNVKVTTFNTSQTNGAVFKNGVINWGDNSANTTSTNLVGQTHQYAKDGTYTIQATAHFTVNGEDVTAAGVNCSKQVTFSTTKPPVVVPPTTPPTTPTPPATPTTLVNTGAGSVMGMFAAATIAGATMYRRILTRRLGNQ